MKNIWLPSLALWSQPLKKMEVLRLGEKKTAEVDGGIGDEGEVEREGECVFLFGEKILKLKGRGGCREK